MSNEEEDAKFAAAVRACAGELREILPELAKRYDQLVVVAAMIEHVGGGLRILTRRGICTEEQARRVLHQLQTKLGVESYGTS